MTDAKPGPASPNNVLAVMNGDQAATEALTELNSGGFEAAQFQGEEFALAFDPKAEYASAPERILKAIQDHFTEEFNYLAQYAEEARDGKVIIAVDVKGREDADAVNEILQRHGGYNVRFFGRMAVTDLTPESNPTPRSEESKDRWSET